MILYQIIDKEFGTYIEVCRSRKEAWAALIDYSSSEEGDNEELIWIFEAISNGTIFIQELTLKDEE